MNKNFSQAIAYKIHKAVFIMDKLADSTLQNKLDLTFSQFLVLMSVVQNPKIKQIDIADFLELTQAAVSRQIEVLKNKGLITISQNEENRRENLLSPTVKGKEIFIKANAILHETFDDLYKVMNEKEKENLEKSLNKLLFSVCGKSKSWNC